MSAPTRAQAAGGSPQSSAEPSDEPSAERPGQGSAETSGDPSSEQTIRDAAARIAQAGEAGHRTGLYPVNRPMIDHWMSALDSYRPPDEMTPPIPDDVPVLAPPAMIQVWTMPGLRARWGQDDPLSQMMSVLDQAGYTSVVATNGEQTYHRYLREGEQVSVSARLVEVTGPKRTALGDGWFVTTLNTWSVDDEPVAEMLFRVLKFRPPTRPSPPEAATSDPGTPAPTPAEPTPAEPTPAEPAPADSAAADSAAADSAAPSRIGDPLRPVISRDTEFFWAGTAARELRVQQCEDCGALRHPPGPRCTACGSRRRGYRSVAGIGTVFSFVVHHHPPVSGRVVPFVVALVELPEGVRMLGELVEVDPLNPVDVAAVRVGAPVEVVWQPVDDDLTLPAWRLRADR